MKNLTPIIIFNNLSLSNKDRVPFPTAAPN